MNRITLLLLVIISFSAIGQGNLKLDQLFPIDAGHSYVEFSIPYMGYAKVKGRFADFNGMVRYDKDNLASTSVSLAIKTESIDTDLDFRDKDLKSENWMDAVKFPTIIFKSKKINKTGSGFDLTGDLTIKGITKEVVLKMNLPSGVMKDVRADLQVIFSGTTMIDRTAFGIEGKNWSAVKEGVAGVGNEVAIEVSILGKQPQPKNFENRVKFTPGAGKVYQLIKEKSLQAGLDEFKNLKDSQSPDFTANVLASIGMLFRLEGKLDDAQTLYDLNKVTFPDRWEVYYSLGELSLLRGERDKARAYFEEALKRDPENVRIMEVLRDL
jgi:polyisoprenoid-binding protein YceI